MPDQVKYLVSRLLSRVEKKFEELSFYVTFTLTQGKLLSSVGQLKE